MADQATPLPPPPPPQDLFLHEDVRGLHKNLTELRAHIQSLQEGREAEIASRFREYDDRVDKKESLLGKRADDLMSVIKVVFGGLSLVLAAAAFVGGSLLADLFSDARSAIRDADSASLRVEMMREKIEGLEAKVADLTFLVEG